MAAYLSPIVWKLLLTCLLLGMTGCMDKGTKNNFSGQETKPKTVAIDQGKGNSCPNCCEIPTAAELLRQAQQAEVGKP